MSRILLLQKSLSERQIKKKIFKLMRPLIQAPDITDHLFALIPRSEEAVLDIEYKSVFETQNPNNYDEEGEHKYYKLTIFNN